MARKPAFREPEPPKPAKLAYARVSPCDQDERMQIDALLKAGVPKNNIFRERIGAGVTSRPQYELLMRNIRKGDTVYAWRLDSLGKSAVELYDMVEQLHAKGAYLHIVTIPGMDTSTPSGRLLVTMLGLFAAFERHLARERTMIGLAAARERGKTGGRRSKFTDEQVLALLPYGTAEAMRRTGMSKSGWLGRLRAAQIRAEQTRLQMAQGVLQNGE